jgi:hypothetical protein
MPPQFIELGVLLCLIVLISAGVLLWLQSQKKRLHPMVQVLALILLVTLLLASLRYGTGINGAVTNSTSTADNPFRQALEMLNERYPSYTTTNNINGISRDVLFKRFQEMEKLELDELKPKVSAIKALIQDAPSSGQSGIYNMRMTSEIQARWNELRQALEKRAQ